MNILEEQERIRGYSDNILQEGLSRPQSEASFTQFLGAIEMTKRRRQQKAASAAVSSAEIRNSPGSVIDELVNDFSGLRQQRQVPQQRQPGLSHGGMPGYAHGGMVAGGDYRRHPAGGGLVQGEVQGYHKGGMPHVHPHTPVMGERFTGRVPEGERMEALRNLWNMTKRGVVSAYENRNVPVADLVRGRPPIGPRQAMQLEQAQPGNINTGQPSQFTDMFTGLTASGIEGWNKLIGSSDGVQSSDEVIEVSPDDLGQQQVTDGAPQTPLVDPLDAEYSRLVDKLSLRSEEEAAAGKKSQNLAEALALAKMAEQFFSKRDFLSGAASGTARAMETLSIQQGAERSRMEKAKDRELRLGIAKFEVEARKQYNADRIAVGKKEADNRIRMGVMNKFYASDEYMNKSAELHDDPEALKEWADKQIQIRIDRAFAVVRSEGNDSNVPGSSTFVTGKTTR